jgi:hypothetical protein
MEAQLQRKPEAGGGQNEGLPSQMQRTISQIQKGKVGSPKMIPSKIPKK